MKKSVLLLIAAVLLTGLAGCGAEKNPTDPKLIKLPEYKLLTLRMKGPYQKMGGAFQQVYAQLGQLQVKPAGVPFAVYYNSPMNTKPADYDWEVCVPVDKKVDPKLPVKFRIQPARQVVTVKYSGEFGTKEHTGSYATIMTFVSNQQGLQFSGPPVEVYHELKGVQGGKKNVTQIYFPVQKK